MARVRYPLTEEAKEAARRLVEAWEARELPQLFTLSEFKVGGQILGTIITESNTFKAPPLSIFWELSKFNLVSVQPNSQFLLMQELRNAVQSDFEVSDFYLTTHAVGTIINAAENASVIIPALQSAAAGTGDIRQTQIVTTTSELVAELLTLLGDIDDPELLEAIRGLETAAEPEQRKRKFGAVIQQLGNGLQHVANTAVVIQSLLVLAQFMYHNKIF
jgi:hypothetical protein